MSISSSISSNELAEKGKGRFGSGWVWLCQSNDGKLFVRQDTSGVGIATTVRTVNPWSENFISGGEHSIYYTGGDVGVGTDNPTAKLDVDGTVNVSGDANISGVSTLSGNVNLTGNITSNVTIVSTDAGKGCGKRMC